MSVSTSFNTSEEEKQTSVPFNKSSLSLKERNSPSFDMSHRLLQVLTSRKKIHKLLWAFQHFVVRLQLLVNAKGASVSAIKVRAWSRFRSYAAFVVCCVKLSPINKICSCGAHGVDAYRKIDYKIIQAHTSTFS